MSKYEENSWCEEEARKHSMFEAFESALKFKHALDATYTAVAQTSFNGETDRATIELLRDARETELADLSIEIKQRETDFDGFVIQMDKATYSYVLNQLLKVDRAQDVEELVKSRQLLEDCQR